MKTIFSLLFTAILSVSVQAQVSQAKDSLAYFLGNWSGTGTITENGTETKFNQTEIVTWAAGETIVVGNGQATNAESGEPMTSTMVSVYYATDGTGFHMHIFTSEGVQVIADVTFPEPGVIHWKYDVPKGQMQFELTVKDGAWTERGYFKPADTTNRYMYIEVKMTKDS